MKKTIIALIALVVCGVGGNVMAGQVGLPTERLALPAVSSSDTYLVCIWDETAGQWLQAFEPYDSSGTYDFQVPAWGKWYWVGLWDETTGQYVFGKWIGHFLAN